MKFNDIDFDNYSKNYPNAENQYQRTISIPLFPDESEEQSDYVIETISKIGKENHI